MRTSDPGYRFCTDVRQSIPFCPRTPEALYALATSNRSIPSSLSKARKPSTSVLSTSGIRDLHGAPEGEGPRGKRAYGKVPRNCGKNTTLIAAITLEGAMGESMTVKGATDALAFEAYVEHFLAPSLCEGQVVVLDGLGAHSMEKVVELIEARGADLVFLPSYSPDLNPIEEAISKIKHLVRKAGAHTREALVEAMARALAAVTTEDVAGWFAHAGYWPQDQPL
jgi:transposase